MRGSYSDVLGEITYFFDDDFSLSDDAKSELKSVKNYAELVNAYIPMFNENDTKEEWFAKMQQLADQFNFAKNGKEYKANPSAFNGDISSVVKVFRILITGKTMSPDLSEIQHVMGRDRVLSRLNSVNNIYRKNKK